MTNKTYTKKDYENSREVRWCPGCGDYAILAAFQKAMVKLQIPPEKVVIISGIGCSSRFPYYMNTYGFHTIHGRAPTIATGLKLMRPDLSVWLITGDGDGLSIGAGHLMHLIRRNVNINVLLFNNQIYGLTKGQYSPTSEVGKITPTTPMGSYDHPVNPMKFALAQNVSFLGRGIDVDQKGLIELFTAAHQHQGCSFVEIFQNCNVYNDGAFTHFSHAATRADKTIFLRPEAPAVFGKDNNKFLEFKAGHGFAVSQSADTSSAHIHNPNTNALGYFQYLSELNSPVPLGIIKKFNRAIFEMNMRSEFTQKKLDQAKFEKLFAKNAETWKIKK